MNGEKTGNNGFHLAAFLAVIICAGFVFWNIRDIPSSFEFVALAEKVEESPKITIIEVGDIMLDRNVRNLIQERGFNDFFKGVERFISGADIAVGNLEGPFTTFDSVTASLKSKELKFTFDPSLAPELSTLGFDILGLANNHSLNFGTEGLNMTRQFIKSAGMSYYGEPNNADEISKVVEKNGIKVGFVGFHEFSYLNYDKVLSEIDRLRPDVDVLVVSPHWGIEYQKEATDFQKRWAHQFIDHGADAVIGAHPHVVGDMEEYKGKKIFYSLGNFVFDQYFSDETMSGLAVEMNIEKTDSSEVKINYNTINIRIDKNGPVVY